MDTSSSDIAGARRVSISAASARESRSWANCTSPTLPRAPRPEWGYRPARQLTPTATHLPPSLLRRTRRRGRHRRNSESGSEHRRPLLRTVRDQMCHRPHGVVMRRAFYPRWGDVLPPRWTSSSSQERSSNGRARRREPLKPRSGRTLRLAADPSKIDRFELTGIIEAATSPSWQSGKAWDNRRNTQ